MKLCVAVCSLLHYNRFVIVQALASANNNGQEMVRLIAIETIETYLTAK